ncbi:hypothetical protein BKA57DRAFT_474927 [Linnemannia elongata]|nr:hypothetical protein BKA57DRAFT_474927 [Linnemannia elongata]
MLLLLLLFFRLFRRWTSHFSTVEEIANSNASSKSTPPHCLCPLPPCLASPRHATSFSLFLSPSFYEHLCSSAATDNNRF